MLLIFLFFCAVFFYFVCLCFVSNISCVSRIYPFTNGNAILSIVSLRQARGWSDACGRFTGLWQVNGLRQDSCLLQIGGLWKVYGLRHVNNLSQVSVLLLVIGLGHGSGFLCGYSRLSH